MLKQMLIATVLLTGSDFCLGEPERPRERNIISLQSIVILPNRTREPLQVAQRSFGEQRGDTPTASFGDSGNRTEGRSLVWGVVGAGIGFNKRF